VIEKRLQDAERRGALLTFSAEQVIQLFAIACENPEYRLLVLGDTIIRVVNIYTNLDQFLQLSNWYLE
jgi:hypothetical protein